MDTINQMRIFVRVVDLRTFTGAADSMNTSPGAISRAVSELEGHLRTRLFNRTTRKVALTPVGAVYFERCKHILAEIERAEEEAGNAQQRPVGKLRIHSFTGFGQYYVLPAIKEYRDLYSEVEIDLTLSHLMPKLYEGTSDVAIVATSSVLPDSEVVSHLLGASFSVLCASPEYLHSHGRPQTPTELQNYECLILDTPAFPAYEWLLESSKGAESMKVAGPVKLNTVESMAAATRASMGIGVLPVYAALDGLTDGSLVRVLPEYTLQKMNIFALNPSRRYTDARIRTWIEFLRQYLPTATARDVHLLEQHSKYVTNEP
ncbi:LysR family transcriptional regulator [Paraburkholderia dipogonis]|uniref:LysR family transcriptional regulator n=1 Tax=Paraburkholderia dipogonis TaxID=1211383 RepID=UPI0038B7019E